MAAAKTNIRLRVTVSSSVKFYISIDAKSSLSDLKFLVADILDREYSYRMREFVVKSSDGYEILDRFTVGEVLEDNQQISVEADILSSRNSFSPRENKRQPTKIRKEVPIISVNEKGFQVPNTEFRNDVFAESSPSNNIAAYYKKNEEILKQKMEAGEKMKQQIALQKDAVVQEENKPVVADTVSAPPVKEVKKKLTPAEDFGLADENHDFESSKEMQMFPTGFKGFAVRKKDVSGGKPTSELFAKVFKPLKRKKEEGYDLL